MSFVRLLLLILAGLCPGSIYVESEKAALEPRSAGEIVRHSYYDLAYSEEHEQAFWVYYRLTAAQVDSPQKRAGNFRADPSVRTGSATPNDYKNSGYDRGHLCPAADMKQNIRAMSETFYMSNMSPQVAGFNRGIWSKLENQVRIWARKYTFVWVVTGPLFEKTLGEIGANRVTVPGCYYKIVYSEKNGMIGFILPNQASSLPLDRFAVKVDEIEAKSGIDFFPGLPDSVENRLEGELDPGKWIFN